MYCSRYSRSIIIVRTKRFFDVNYTFKVSPEPDPRSVASATLELQTTFNSRGPVKNRLQVFLLLMSEAVIEVKRPIYFESSLLIPRRTFREILQPDAAQFV
jgi:hypothetical protein